MDRQDIVENLTAIETTAKLLLNALTKKKDEKQSIDDIHRKELVCQTKNFLLHAHDLIDNLSNNLNVPSETLSFVSTTNENEQTKKIFSLTSISLDEIIEHHLTIKDLLPNVYPSISIHLFSFIRSLRSIESLDDLIIQLYTKIFTHEERLYCTVDGINGKLFYPPLKRFLFNRLLQLLLQERNRTLNDDEQRQFYHQCEKIFANEIPSEKICPIQLDQIDGQEEKQWVTSLASLIFTSDDLKRILRAKQELSSPWNTNEILIYHARLLHLRWCKQKWLEQYPSQTTDESQRWSQCIDWILDSFNQQHFKIRSSKRKPIETTNEQKRTKPVLSLQEQCQKIDRMKYDVFQYANEVLQCIATLNEKQLPTFEQLKYLRQLILRFYWTSNDDQTWSSILDMIEHLFASDCQETSFRSFYFQQLLNQNQNDREHLERLIPSAH